MKKKKTTKKIIKKKKQTKKKNTAAGSILSISGPVVRAINIPKAKINDIVFVGEERLLGEIIELVRGVAVIQVYEETDGVLPGEPVVNTGRPLSVALGPGLLTTVYDGIQRPLEIIKETHGSFIPRSAEAEPLDSQKEWIFNPVVTQGEEVSEGDVLGTVDETSIIQHKVLVPPGVSGTITSISSGSHTISQTVAKIKDEKTGETHNLTMVQYWPVRIPRPIKEKLPEEVPLVTGQRIYDFFFPSVKGGQCAIPGPFGSGKTVTQQAIAKWCDAQIIVYIGCGERGNEMTEVLREFPELKDPKSGKPLMDRTILIANTSNMPVAAREASIYTGITIAEYFRDQGYDVALMADSTSRWAEAMREISGRLEEMPGEEGYPAYLSSRLSSYYERAGRVTTLGSGQGSVTVIGAVSPPGGDFSEPVTQNTLRTTKVFWALDAKLAAKRHYWAINWLRSYSLYIDNTDPWFNKNVDKEWSKYRAEAMKVLQQEAQLLEIAQLIGKDSLPEHQQVILLAGKLLREDLLQQNAFDKNDMYCPIEKQFLMAKNIIDFFVGAFNKVKNGDLSFSSVEESEFLKDLAHMKYLPAEEATKSLNDLNKKMRKQFEVEHNESA